MKGLLGAALALSMTLVGCQGDQGTQGGGGGAGTQAQDRTEGPTTQGEADRAQRGAQTTTRAPQGGAAQMADKDIPVVKHVNMASEHADKAHRSVMKQDWDEAKEDLTRVRTSLKEANRRADQEVSGDLKRIEGQIGEAEKAIQARNTRAAERATQQIAADLNRVEDAVAQVKGGGGKPKAGK